MRNYSIFENSISNATNYMDRWPTLSTLQIGLMDYSQLITWQI